MQSDPSTTTSQPMCDDTIALEERKDLATATATASKDTGSASKEPGASKDLLLAESNDRYVLFPIKDNDIFGLSPSREELMAEIQAVNAKVEGLADYIAQFLTITTKGLEGLID